MEKRNFYDTMAESAGASVILLALLSLVFGLPSIIIDFLSGNFLQ